MMMEIALDTDKKIQLFTSYFGRMKKIKSVDPDMVFISICGKAPTWFTGPQFKILAPRWVWWREWHDKFQDDLDGAESVAWYSQKYAKTVLSKLDPKRVSSELEDIITENGGSRGCLLCFETPEKFCHRHLAARWLSGSGIPCSEWTND